MATDRIPHGSQNGLPPVIVLYSENGLRRNFVKKAINWALRQIGKRSPELRGPALSLAEKLANSELKPARWIGRDAARELNSPAVIEALRRKEKK